MPAMRRLGLARHLAARYPALAVGPLLLVGVFGWLLLPASPAYQSVAADPSGRWTALTKPQPLTWPSASGLGPAVPAASSIAKT